MANQEIDFGRIAFVYEDDWDGNKSYQRLSTVFYPDDGCSYIAKKANRGVTPGTDPLTWGKIAQKGGKGDKGDTPAMSLERDAQGYVYILADGRRLTNPDNTPLTINGPKGDKGDPFTFNDLTEAQKAQIKGNTGAAAGFGTPVATINNAVGTPSVTVTASGPDTAKVFTFTFKNLKGEKGDQGNPGSNASVTDAAIAAFGYTKNAGTVTGVKINGTTKNPSSGIVNLGTVITDVSGKEDKSNKVTSISSSSTDAQYPSAKCVYTIVGNIETLLAAI